MAQTGTGLVKGFDLAERAITALETIADALTAPKSCAACDEGGRLRCPTHGVKAPTAWTDHPIVAAHIAVGCDVVTHSSSLAFCNTHNTGIELHS